MMKTSMMATVSPEMEREDGNLSSLVRIANEIAPSLLETNAADGGTPEFTISTTSEWRAEIIRLWMGTLFSELHAVRQPSIAKYYLLGFTFGLKICLDKFIDGTALLPDERLALKRLISKRLAEAPVKSARRLKSPRFRTKIFGQAQELSLLESRNFFAGLVRGLGSMFSDETTLKNDETTTKVYMFLMLQGQIEKRYRSVEEIYDFAKSKMGNELVHSLDSFRRMCTRIGLKGEAPQKSMDT